MIETQLVIFLAFASVTVVANTLLFLFAYRGFASLTLRITDAVREFETNDTTRLWVKSLASAAETARQVSEDARERLREFDPVLARAQEGHARLLAETDRKLEGLAEAATANAMRMRNSMLKPAAHVHGIADVINEMLGD